MVTIGSWNFCTKVTRRLIFLLNEVQVISLVREEGFPMEERRISLTEFHTADEVCKPPCSLLPIDFLVIHL